MPTAGPFTAAMKLRPHRRLEEGTRGIGARAVAHEILEVVARGEDAGLPAEDDGANRIVALAFATPRRGPCTYRS
jgi:hypothetical protein